MEQITNKEIIEKLRHIERTMVTKKEFEEAFETFAVLSNEETMQQIKNSERDIKEGKTRKINNIREI